MAFIYRLLFSNFLGKVCISDHAMSAKEEFILLESEFEKLKELFLRYGISLGEKTPVLGHERGLEIKQYLKEHADIDQYLILDDDMFDSFDEELRKNLILTKEDQEDHSYGDGLQMKHIEQIIKRFGRVKKKDHDIDDER